MDVSDKHKGTSGQHHNHDGQTNLSNDLSCVECGKSFRTSSWSLCCDACNKQIMNDKQEQEILANDIIEKENNLTCEHCGKNFSFIGCLRRHRQCGGCEYLKPETLYKCSTCGKSFNRKDNCIKHIRNVCSKSGANKMTLTVDRFETTPTFEEDANKKPQPIWECPKCKRGFTRKDNYTRHIKLKRCRNLMYPYEGQNDEKIVSCDTKSSSSTDAYQVKVQNSYITRSKDWSKHLQECVVCGRNFESPSWTYCCDNCTEGIAAESGKKSEKELVTQHTKDVNPTCKYCGKMFRKEYYIKRHIDSGACIGLPMPQPKWKCPKCKRGFTRKDYYTKHVILKRCKKSYPIDVQKNERIPNDHDSYESVQCCNRNHSNRDEIGTSKHASNLLSSPKPLQKSTRLNKSIKCRNRLCKYCLKTFHSTSHLQRHLFYGACKWYKNEMLKNPSRRNKSPFHRRYKYYINLKKKRHKFKLYFTKVPKLGTITSSVKQTKTRISEQNKKKEQSKLHRTNLELECINCMRTFLSLSWRLCCDECLDLMKFSNDKEERASMNSFKHADNLKGNQVPDVTNNITEYRTQSTVQVSKETNLTSIESKLIKTDMELECSNCMATFTSSTWRLCCDKCLDEMQFSSKEDVIYANRLEELISYKAEITHESLAVDDTVKEPTMKTDTKHRSDKTNNAHEAPKVPTSTNCGKATKHIDKCTFDTVNATEHRVNIMEANMCSREEDDCKRPRIVDHNRNEVFSQQNCTQIVSNVTETEESQDQISVPCKSLTVIDKKDLCHRKRTEKKSYLCGKCGKVVRRVDQLRRHILQVHTSDRPYQCKICGKSFKFKRYLEKCHMRIHSGERPCVCEICGKRFATACTLKIHKMYHGEKKFKCALCDKMTHTKVQLQRHLTTHTGERAFVCKVCNKAFKVEAALMRHMLIHTGDQPYQCKYCKRQFNQNCSLKRHERIHTGERPYHCPHCEKVFIQSASLTKHLVTHKSKKNFETSFTKQAH